MENKDVPTPANITIRTRIWDLPPNISITLNGTNPMPAVYVDINTDFNNLDNNAMLVPLGHVVVRISGHLALEEDMD